MPSVALMASKGGAGKTTLAIHLAALAGPGTVLADLDPQQSAADWCRSRQADYPTGTIGKPADLVDMLRRRPAGSWTLVDTEPHPGHATAIIEQVAPHVDLCLVPVRGSVLDLRAIRPAAEALKAVGAKAAVVLNGMQPRHGVAEREQTQLALLAAGELGLPVCPVLVRHRASYVQALNDGRAVSEFDPRGQAAQEMRDLWRWLHGQVSADDSGQPRTRGRGRSRAQARRTGR
jgi:chromosome partitioning protein